MNTIIKKDLKLNFGLNKLADLLHTQEGSAIYQRAEQLWLQNKQFIKPCLALRAATIETVSENQAIISGQDLNSRIFAKKMDAAASTYVYVLSCGMEIYNRLKEYDDPLDNYILDQIAYLGYLSAREDLHLCIETELGLPYSIMIAPGSVIDWSVAENHKLFAILDGAYQQLNLSILASGLINPLKSGLGLVFAAEEEFSSCSICPKANCPTRQVEFDEEAHNQFINT